MYPIIFIHIYRDVPMAAFQFSILCATNFFVILKILPCLKLYFDIELDIMKSNILTTYISRQTGYISWRLVADKEIACKV